MNYLTVDYLILYTFIVIILTVGFRAGRNIKDIRDFAVGGGIYGTGALILTYLATDMGPGSVFEGVSWPFSRGIIGLLVYAGLVVPFIIRAIWIAPKMYLFKECSSIADVMGKLYGSTSRYVTAILGILCSVCIVSFGLYAFGVMCESILNIPVTLGVVVCGLIIALYTAHGGIRSVTATDKIQFLALFIVIILIASVVLIKVGGITSLFSKVPAEKFQVIHTEKFTFYLTLFLSFSIFSVGITDPPIFQRLLMAKDAKQIRNQYFAISFIDPMVRSILMLIGFGGLVLFPCVEENYILPHIIQALLPIGFKGLAMAGMVAVVMGCVDSYLHIAGVLVAHDIVGPIFNSKKINELAYARFAIIIVSLFSIWISLNAISSLDICTEVMTATGPIIAFPLMAGILGLKPDKRSFLFAMYATIVTFVAARLLLPIKYEHFSVIISLLVNIIIFLTTHYIQNKGFVVVKRECI